MTQQLARKEKVESTREIWETVCEHCGTVTEDRREWIRAYWSEFMDGDDPLDLCSAECAVKFFRGGAEDDGS